MFLMNRQETSALRFHLLANPAAISEALDYDRFLSDPSTPSKFFRFVRLASCVAFRVQRSLGFYTDFWVSVKAFELFRSPPIAFEISFAAISGARDYSTIGETLTKP